MSKYYKAEDIERLIENIINVMIGKEEPIETALCELPTIDIVHCKDCKNVTYKTNPVRTQDVFYGCHYSEIQHDGDFYCAYGERIEK